MTIAASGRLRGILRLSAATTVAGAAAAFAQAVPPAPAPDEGAALVPVSPYEPGLMVLALAGVLILGGAIVRLLVALRLIRRIEWTILPVLLFLSGALWLFLKIGGFADVPNLRALAGFLFAFLLFVSVLVPLARWLLPTRALRTRGGIPPLLRGMAVITLALVGLFVLLSWAFPGLSFTPVFVTSGVVSIVLGLALQDSLGNVMSGLAMSIERPFKVGDWVRIGETEGEVVELSWRATLVRTRESDHVWIPNSAAIRDTVYNFEQPTPDHLVKIHIGVAYDTPCGLAIEALRDAASRVEEVLRTPAPAVYLKDFQDSAILYELRVWIDNYGSLHGIESEVRKQIWYAFKRYGVTIPFPQRDVHLYPAPDEPKETFCRLVVTGGPLRGAMFPLCDRAATIGRAADNTIVVSDQRVSNRQAIIEPHEGGHRLRDLESRHGTSVNGQLVVSARLSPGDVIGVGPISLVYETNWAPPAVRAAARVVAAPPGRHLPPGATSGATVGTSGASAAAGASAPDTPAPPGGPTAA
jgi:small-conductance mechanosensitive channel